MIEIFLYLLTGIIAGLLAGLFGIGGGIIVVPMLATLFSYQHFPPELLMHIAVGTSFAVMIFTTLSSAFAYHRRGLVLWPLFYKFIPGLLLGTLTGSIIAKQLSSNSLRIAFAVFLLIIALNLFFPKTIKAQRHQLPSLVIISSVAFAIGILSGFFGIGGGTMMVPFFMYSNLEMHKAAGTSAICGFPLAILGTLSFMLTGWTVTIANYAPLGMAGYVYWPAALLIAITSLIFAPLGTRLAVSISGLVLARLFSIVLILTAINLII